MPPCSDLEIKDYQHPIVGIGSKVMTSASQASAEATTGDALIKDELSHSYWGTENALILPMNPLAEVSRRQLQEISDSLGPLCKDDSSDVNHWRRLREHIDTSIFDLQEKEYRKFQHDLLHQSIIPYLKSMQNHWLLDVNRFNQVEHLLRSIITEQDEVSQRQHPAVLLLEVERIKEQIAAKKHMFKSQLGSSLTRILDRQWQPILRDMRKGLTSLGTKFMGLGLIEILGRPLIVLYPLGYGILEIVEIIKLLEAKKTISLKSYMELLKCACYLWGTWQLLAITATYASMGWLCLFIGITFLLLTSDDSLIKYATPFLAPQLALLDKLSFSVEKLQSKLVASIESGGWRGHSRSDVHEDDSSSNSSSSSSSRANGGVSTSSNGGVLRQRRSRQAQPSDFGF